MLAYVEDISQEVDLWPPSFGEGYLPIHLAVVLDQREILDALLDNGVDKDKPDAIDRTPLLVAILYGPPSTIKAPLVAGAYAHASDYCHLYPAKRGETIDDVVSPLQLAAIEKDPCILMMFIENMVDIDPTEPGVGGALHSLVCVFDGDPKPDETVRRVDMCVDAGADIDLLGDVFIHEGSMSLQVVANGWRTARRACPPPERRQPKLPGRRGAQRAPLDCSGEEYS